MTTGAVAAAARNAEAAGVSHCAEFETLALTRALESTSPPKSRWDSTYSYGPNSYDVYSYGPHPGGTHPTVMAQIVMAYIVMAHIQVGLNL